MSKKEFKTFQGILRGSKLVLGLDNFILVCFRRGYDTSPYEHKLVYVGGVLERDTLLVEEVVIA